MTKEQMTERLQELAVILGREADISGSKADLEQRLAEWEEEAECIHQTDEISDEVPEVQKTERVTQNATDLVRVRMKVTAHLCAFDERGTRRVEFALAGQIVSLEPHRLASVIAAGVAEVCHAVDA
ncbi:DNA breaking-rejoining protein [Escherichia coli]|uniref:Putative DNA packaging protein from phage origin n=2 Tax=Escherichia coli TaxID=562 RepID=A0A2S8JIV7_ECOLX|nr:DNA-packaging protein FI [Escherichia coli]EBQ5257461.1 DNA breaking-rejoining protein [Salmonella enterica]EBZ2215061.1 DNA breaking-rejoining protein [Salmonella enterica subsp. enterica serovar Montevideo]ECH8887678.1 DNA breaking-rejoining protein [Salmonella enterica subsp. enterica]EDS9959327.1 DNA breaking-rejoining protein [Salmonella enterica subsp. enterica serovar Kisangani]EII1142181.1 DNA breaking-rejoining protein [Escherichia coli O121]